MTLPDWFGAVCAAITGVFGGWLLFRMWTGRLTVEDVEPAASWWYWNQRSWTAAFRCIAVWPILSILGLIALVVPHGTVFSRAVGVLIFAVLFLLWPSLWLFGRPNFLVAPAWREANPRLGSSPESG